MTPSQDRVASTRCCTEGTEEPERKTRLSRSTNRLRTTRNYISGSRPPGRPSVDEGSTHFDLDGPGNGQRMPLVVSYVPSPAVFFLCYNLLMSKNIECEIRAEVRSKDFDKVLKDLKKRGKFVNKTERLSVMYFRCADSGDLDLRVRITNGECEVVMKQGDHHAANRVETEQPITRDQFVGMARVFRQFEWDSVKVGERTTYNFDFGSDVLISLVRGGDICYLEIEKMAEPKTLKKIESELKIIAVDLGVDLIKTRSEYYKLCQRFTDETDWALEDKDGHYRKLAKQLSNF